MMVMMRIEVSGTTSNARPVHPARDETPARVARWDGVTLHEVSHVVNTTLDELDVAACQAQLTEAMLEARHPVRVEGGHLLVNESAMLHDAIYPVRLNNSTYYVILRGDDDALEIYGVEPDSG